MLFKKSKRRHSASPGRPYSLIGPCLLPPAALIAAPRLPLTTYEPIVLRPITAYGAFANPISYTGEELLDFSELQRSRQGRESRNDKNVSNDDDDAHRDDHDECNDDNDDESVRSDECKGSEVYDRITVITRQQVQGPECQGGSESTVYERYDVICCDGHTEPKEIIDTTPSNCRENFSTAEYPAVSTRRTDGSSRRRRSTSSGRQGHAERDTVILGPPESFRDCRQDADEDDIDAHMSTQSRSGSPGGARDSTGLRGSGGGGSGRMEGDMSDRTSPNRVRRSGDSERISMRKSGERTRSPRVSYDDENAEKSGKSNRTYEIPSTTDVNKSGNNPLSDTIANSTLMSTISRLSMIDDSSQMIHSLELEEAELERRRSSDNQRLRVSREKLLLASQQLQIQQLQDSQQQRSAVKSETLQDTQLTNALKDSQDVADRTLKVRDELIDCLRGQIERLKEEKHQMVSDFKQLRAAGFLDDQVSGGGGVRRQTGQDNKEELDTLKSLVVRLNTELDRYQRNFRKLSPSELDEAPGLPMRGPKPSWLVNTKCLAPLLTAYDDQLHESESIIEEYEADMDKFRVRFEELLRENERLHICIEQTDNSSPNNLTEWRSLQEQCKLVLEENQLLMTQLSVQQAKEKDLTKSYLIQVSTLKQRTSAAEAECAQCRSELSELQKSYSALKRAHDDSSLEARLKISPEQHIETVSAVKQTLQEEKLRLMSELSEANANLQVSEAEKKSLTREIDKLREMLRSREEEIRSSTKQNKKNQRKIELLQLTIDDMEAVATKVNRYLATVLKTADMTAKERDSLVISLQEKDKNRLSDLKKMVSETDDIKKLQEKIKTYSSRKKQKLQNMSLRLEEQSKDFHLQRDEYERELRYLRQLIKERDELVNTANGDKQEMLEDLETMWQVASRDNLRMRDTMVRAARKLHDHASLRACLPPEDIRGMELDDILHQTEANALKDSGVITGGRAHSSDTSSRIMID